MIVLELFLSICICFEGSWESCWCNTFYWLVSEIVYDMIFSFHIWRIADCSEENWVGVFVSSLWLWDRLQSLTPYAYAGIGEDNHACVCLAGLVISTCAAILSCLARGQLSGFESHRADVITVSEHGWTVYKSGATISPRTWKVGSHLFRRTWHDLSFCYSLATTTESVISTIWLLPIGISFSFTSRCMNSGSKLNTNNQIRRSRLQRHRLFPSPIITFNLDWSGCALKLKPAFPSSSKAHRSHCILFYFHIVCMQGIALASRGV